MYRTGRVPKRWAELGGLDAEPARVDYSPASGRLVAALTNNSIALWGLRGAEGAVPGAGVVEAL